MASRGLLLPAFPTSAGYRRSPPPLSCVLTKQGNRFLSSLATSEEHSAVMVLLRKFVASSSKQVALTTLLHILSPSNYHSRHTSLAYPLYSVIKQESWFQWNTKLVADLIALLWKEEMFDEAEKLIDETKLKLGHKKRDIFMFYCKLVASHAKHKSETGVLNSCVRLKQLILQSSSFYVSQKGYASMVGGLCEVGLPSKAEDLMEEMEQNGLKPSMFELRSLVYGYGQIGYLEDMKRSIIQMEKGGFELDTVCYNMVLSSFGVHNQLSEMLSWLKKMRKSGIPYSIRTYNSVLNSCQGIMLLLEDVKSLPYSIDELVKNLNMEEADMVLELLKSSVLDQVMDWKLSELRLDLHGMHRSTAYLILLQWFDELKRRFLAGNQIKKKKKKKIVPTEILVVCGCGKHSATRGESPVRGLAKEIIWSSKCPLRIDRKNIGCFIAKGKVFKDWLLQHNTARESRK